jgi:hypothetical protein
MTARTALLVAVPLFALPATAQVVNRTLLSKGGERCTVQRAPDGGLVCVDRR